MDAYAYIIYPGPFFRRGQSPPEIDNPADELEESTTRWELYMSCKVNRKKVIEAVCLQLEVLSLATLRVFTLGIGRKSPRSDWHTVILP